MGIGRFLRRRHWDEERRRELESYVEIESDANLARGYPPDEARRRALRKLGNPTVVREDIYYMNTLTWFESAWQDIRFGARLLRRSPGFTAVALLSLALGIGANGAIFQLLDVVRLRTLPVHDPASMVEVRVAPSDGGRTGSFRGSRPALTKALWDEIQAHVTTITGLFAYGTARFDLSAGGESRRAEGIFVSGGYFQALEGRPAVGRLIGPADDTRGCASPGAVISDPFWRREFGGAADVTSRTVRLDGAVFPVMGVVEAGFSGVEVGRRLDVFMPICAWPLINASEPALDQRDYWWLAAFGRLAPGVSIDHASAELASESPGIMTATMPSTYPAPEIAHYAGLTLQAYEAATGVSGLRTQYGDSLVLLLAIAGLVLLIACANLANLMLARGSARAREIAVRLAIGASRPRVFRQLVAESLLLGAVGAAIGIGLAPVISRVLVSLLTSDGSPWALDLRLDARLALFTIGLALVTSVLFGLMPALRATRLPPGSAMNLGVRGQTMDRGRFVVRRLLVVGQVALSLALVVTSLRLVDTLRNLSTGDTGLDDRQVLVVNLDLRPAGIAPAAQVGYQRQVLDRLAAVPGVVSAASTAIVPLSGSSWNDAVIVDGKKQPGYPHANRVSPEYFAALHVAILEGRTFDPRDRAGSLPVSIISHAMAAKYFAGRSAIGRTFHLQVGPGRPDDAYEIVGVVGDTKYDDLREPAGPIMYFPAAQETTPAPFLSALLRTSGDPDAVRASVTRAVAQIDPAIALTLSTMRTDVENLLLRERLMAALAAGFAILAVVLAAAGLYGLMSYSVARRRTEIGVRVALGATSAGIVAMIVRELAVLVVIGVGAGLALAVYAGRAASALLYGVTASDVGTLAAGAGALALVAALATIGPAHRAARLSPTAALREDA